MAEVKENFVVEGSSGRIGKLVVIKIINGKTFITKYPDRTEGENRPPRPDRSCVFPTCACGRYWITLFAPRLHQHMTPFSIAAIQMPIRYAP